MRKDMNKVIVERPRGGWRTRKLNRMKIKEAGEDQPSRIGIRRQRKMNGTETKYLNENLAPLKRYLGKQVGRPWNKVYSELRENISPKNTVQMHILEHVHDFVARPAIGKDGNWLWPGRFLWRSGPHKGQLYIHPADGLLKRLKRDMPASEFYSPEQF